MSIRNTIRNGSENSQQFKKELYLLRRELANCAKDYRKDVKEHGEYDLRSVFSLGRIHGLTSGLSSASHSLFMKHLNSKF